MIFLGGRKNEVMNLEIPKLKKTITQPQRSRNILNLG